MAIAQNVALVGTLEYFWTDSSGTPSPDPEASVVLGLHGYGSQIPRVAGQALFQDATGGIGMLPAPQAGMFELMVYSNDLIEPPGTYYTLTTKNGNGDILQINAYRFIGGGQFDVSTLTPYDPNQPPPALLPLVLNQLLIVPYSATPDFPGDTYTSWQITLNGDATATFSDLVDGNLYTIIVVQDATGGHNFIWPLNVYNPTGPDREANAITVQTFVAVSNLLYPIGAGTYYP